MDTQLLTWLTMAGDKSHRITRGYDYPQNIVKPHANLDVRKNFFSIRVVDKWSSLLNQIKALMTVPPRDGAGNRDTFSG